MSQKLDSGGIKLPDKDEVGAVPETAPFGDGRDGSATLNAFMWVFAGGAAMLLLPRQYWAAGICAIIAAVFAFFVRRKRLRDAPPPPAGEKRPTITVDPE